MLTFRYFLVLCLWTFSIDVSNAQIDVPVKTRILFIFDASNSMNGTWQSGRKIDIARKLVSTALDSLKGMENLEIGLRTYGHLKHFPPQDCDDTKLEVPFGSDNVDKIKKRLYELVPKGTTPIAQSLEKSAGDFTYCKNCRNTIILITDGIEECNGDPCAVSRMLQENGISLKPFVIGIGMDENFKKTFQCVGHYYDASNEETFKNVLGIVISQAMNTTTAQVNLLNVNSQPTETDAVMTFYDNFNKKPKYNIMHTINHRGNPDTVQVDPSFTYDLVIHTIPSVRKDSIDLEPGIHNLIAVDAAQGELLLKAVGNEYKYTPVIIRKKGDMNTLNVQYFNEKEKYLVGDYDVEILSLPRVLIDDVRISQSHTTTVEIPKPGIASITKSPGLGSILVRRKNELEWVCNLKEAELRENITLQPGNYVVVYRPRAAKESIFTVEKSFKIASGGSVGIRLD